MKKSLRVIFFHFKLTEEKGDGTVLVLTKADCRTMEVLFAGGVQD